ncbi:MAG: DUF86 domain-containing protein [Candidatus Eremiobacteraeota bacterium]|nr:DUF86 domain-containing protein [Candidatus Eremiobacteraeota bacterium]
MERLPDDLKEKLNHLLSYLDELEQWLGAPQESIEKRGLQRIVERMFQLIVECAADAGDIWLDAGGFPAGESVRGVFERLREQSLIDEEEILRFAEYVSLRNRIVHDYEKISGAMLLKTAPRLLSDCRLLGKRLLGDAE